MRPLLLIWPQILVDRLWLSCPYPWYFPHFSSFRHTKLARTVAHSQCVVAVPDPLHAWAPPRGLRSRGEPHVHATQGVEDPPSLSPAPRASKRVTELQYQPNERPLQRGCINGVSAGMDTRQAQQRFRLAKGSLDFGRMCKQVSWWCFP